MLKTIAAVAALCASTQAARAGLPFSCQANGDSWAVVGHADHRLQCSFTCILHDPKGNQDAVTCAPAVSDTIPNGPVCEGFLSGRHWTSATLVSGQCASAISPELR